MSRWLKPEVYPLVAAMGFVTSICTFQLVRNMFLNPDVRISKANRTAGVFDNTEEGMKYSQHSFRRFVAGRRPGIMSQMYSHHSSSKESN